MLRTFQRLSKISFYLVYPDPSIYRIVDTYYMVNSSFEWFLGLPIHKSKDLVNWEKIGHGLHSPDQIEFKDGLKNSNGV